MAEKGAFVGKVYHLMINSKGSATVSLTLTKKMATGYLSVVMYVRRICTKGM
jgi:hypothetical protein